MLENPQLYSKLVGNIIHGSGRSRKMDETKTNMKQHGIGFCGLLAIVFITLKLAGIGAVATWSWWWVLSPLWMPFAIFLAIVVVVVIGCIAGRK